MKLWWSSLPHKNFMPRACVPGAHAIVSPWHHAKLSFIGWFNIRLELRSGLLPMVWDSSLRVVRRLDPPWRGWFLFFGIPTTCAWKHKNKDRMPSHPRSLRWSVERHDPSKYWPRSVLLDFQCPNGNLKKFTSLQMIKKREGVRN